MLSLYKYFEKIIPAIIKHRLAPKGSATTPFKPSSTNVAEIPKTASAPNQVAKTEAITIGRGKLLLAIAKSLLVLTFLETNKPIATDKKIYKVTNIINIGNLIS